MELEHTDRLGFTLRYYKGMATLTVHSVQPEGRQVYADDIIARMKILDIPSVPAKKIRDIVAQADGKPHALVEWPAGASLNGRVSIEIEEDKMTARAVVTAPKPGGSPVDRQKLHSALLTAGVIKGIDKKALEECLSFLNTGRSVVVARGKKPQTARPAYTECLFVTERGKPWKELGGGRIDLKELNFIQNRKAGDVLARRIAAVPPVNGYNVCGEILQAGRQPDIMPLKAGKGVIQEGNTFVADIDGNVLLDKGTISMEPLVIVKNVDYSTGNIDSDGSVLVTGTVADGFTLKARGDVHIRKTIGRCNIETGRNLILTSGLVGDGEGTCTVGSSLFARFVENAVVRVQEDLILTEAALHSDIRIGGSLYLTEGRGEITGGTTVAGGSVECKKIGNVYSGTTAIYAGCSPKKFQAYQQIGSRLKTLREESDNLDRQLDYYKSKKGNYSREIMQGEKEKAVRLEELKEVVSTLRQMRSELTAPDGTTVTVRDKVYAGTTLFFGLEEYPLGSKGLEKVVLSREMEKTVMHGYNPLSA
ncbi:MAG: hypothetical protein CSA76_03820 [Spirochaetales bacterium]|nr:MAG: hypothetical protein CSA76_03820 [Spirochaetales bacterium]